MEASFKVIGEVHMKKLLFVVTIITILCSVTSAFADESAKIVYLKGNVKVQRADEGFWILAKKAMLLNNKDKVKTSVASEVEIALDSSLKNIVRLEPNTEIVIEDLKRQKLSMSMGKVLSVIESLSSESSFEVRTPTAVAGVAGSGMSVSTDGKSTNVSCFEDKAYVRGVNVDGTPMVQVIIIDQGYKRIIGQFELPSDLLELTQFERDSWSKFRENLKEHLDWLRQKRAGGSRGAAIAMQKIGRLQERFEDDFENNKDNIFEQDEFNRRDGTQPSEADRSCNIY